ncbi:hypothetical protein CLOLEP_00903 [[Clostridium] leptum DSM 753]|uniref:Uncharacterized protein n=1 Tax=[Clostridium] leptum DSM 753 TaxID=428125 RepID=A7VQS1_9FIRM|nr:hypothetical protein CLOLEP_00903 [[Clostridium] leptum DSM 753]PEQ25096.1 hypothetical protein CH238_06575 [[Clostridium] leptum DSM 753]
MAGKGNLVTGGAAAEKLRRKEKRPSGAERNPDGDPAGSSGFRQDCRADSASARAGVPGRNPALEQQAGIVIYRNLQRKEP